VTHVTEDDLDDLEFATLRTGDHTAAARRLVELAGSVSGGVSRAKILLRAGEQWQHAGEYSEAASCYRGAIDDGGEVYGDPRAYLADVLFELGRPEEARELVAEILAEAPRDPEVYRTIAEVLYAQGDVAGAYDWATAGADVVLAMRKSATMATVVEDAEDSLEALLRLRYRSRIDLGRPEDDYDALLDDLLKG
jgi:tetratricopeptide (TPR) repeat protein